MNARPSAGDENLHRYRINELLEELERVLAAEYKALISRDLDQLEQATQRKNALVEQLDDCAGTLTERPAGSDEIKRLLERCAQANRVNGGAIDMNRNFVAGLLDTLRGHMPGQRTYDSRGRLADHGTSEVFTQI